MDLHPRWQYCLRVPNQEHKGETLLSLFSCLITSLLDEVLFKLCENIINFRKIFPLTKKQYWIYNIIQIIIVFYVLYFQYLINHLQGDVRKKYYSLDFIATKFRVNEEILLKFLEKCTQCISVRVIRVHKALYTVSWNILYITINQKCWQISGKHVLVKCFLNSCKILHFRVGQVQFLCFF